ncbi:MAG: hypothetical protein L7F78_10985, partial [Syntrophales bacterium LBB04]|nr:hypothetical protein [Syntrophales bacterium LBB04]
KGEEIRKETKPEIHLGVAAFIPEDYVADVRRRLIIYKRLSMTEREEELAAIKSELLDCYGFVPDQVNNLCEVLTIKSLLHRMRGKKMDYDGKNMVISFHAGSDVDPAKILVLAREEWPAIRLTPDLQLFVPMPGLKGENILRDSQLLARSRMLSRPLLSEWNT